MKAFTKYQLLLNLISILSLTQAKFTQTYNETEILNQTGWKTLGIKQNAPAYALLSQGVFDENEVEKFDTNFYYPGSAGEGIDIFMFDLGFDFSVDEFSNREERSVKCEVIVTQGVASPSPSEFSCGYNFHGTLTTATAAGKDHGIAHKSNVHGIFLNNAEDLSDCYKNLAEGLKYVKENLFKPNKSVFNFSIGIDIDIDEAENNEDIETIQKLVNEMTEEGAVFVSSAGNNHQLVSDPQTNRRWIPCTLDNVICVGGIANMGIVDQSFIIKEKNKDMPIDKNNMVRANYKLADGITGSNYGNGVDIYTPYNCDYFGSLSLFGPLFIALLEQSGVNPGDFDYFNDGIHNDVIECIQSGTSLSAPIVSGVVATIMSEFPDEEFNSKTMLDYLTKISLKGVIRGLPEDAPNYFLNNGKNLVYSGTPTTPTTTPTTTTTPTSDDVNPDPEENTEVPLEVDSSEEENIDINDNDSDSEEEE
eukprot:jgi/Orpsp1_1/1189215/evm.model.d7180000070364.1